MSSATAKIEGMAEREEQNGRTVAVTIVIECPGFQPQMVTVGTTLNPASSPTGA